MVVVLKPKNVEQFQCNNHLNFFVKNNGCYTETVKNCCSQGIGCSLISLRSRNLGQGSSKESRGCRSKWQHHGTVFGVTPDRPMMPVRTVAVGVSRSRRWYPQASLKSGHIFTWESGHYGGDHSSPVI